MTDHGQTEARLLTEDGLVANWSFGFDENEFVARIDDACSWAAHLPDTREMAKECAAAPDVDALTLVITQWRHTAEAYAVGIDRQPVTNVGELYDELTRVSVSVPGPGLDPVSVTIDFEAEALYVHLGKRESHEDRLVNQTVEITPWLLVDYDADGRPVGVEMLTLHPGKAMRAGT